MGGMFASTETAHVSIMLPFKVTTPAVLGGPLEFDAQSTLANVNVLLARNGTYVNNFTAATSPTGVTVNNPAGFAIAFAFDPATFVNFAVGYWVVYVQSPTAGYEFVAQGSFQWGGIADMIVLTNTRCEQLEPGNAVYDNTNNTNVVLSPGGTIYDDIAQITTQVDDMTVDVAVIKGEVTAGGDLFQNAETSRQIATNRFEVDAGTGIGTLYADDGTTPFATRTVENGDGSALSGAQVLKLGVLTPIP